MILFIKVWEKVKAANPEMKMWDIGKLIGEQWRNLPEDERQVKMLILNKLVSVFDHLLYL